MVLSARSTLNVLKADTLPRSTNSVTYLQQAGRQKHKNRHTQKGMTTLNSKPAQRDRKVEIPQETEIDTVETGQVGWQHWRIKPETRLLRRGNQVFKAMDLDVNWRKGNSVKHFNILMPVRFLVFLHSIFGYPHSKL